MRVALIARMLLSLAQVTRAILRQQFNRDGAGLSSPFSRLGLCGAHS